MIFLLSAISFLNTNHLQTLTNDAYTLVHHINNIEKERKQQAYLPLQLKTSNLLQIKTAAKNLQYSFKKIIYMLKNINYHVYSYNTHTGVLHRVHMLYI